MPLTCAAGTAERVCRGLSGVDEVAGAHVVAGDFDVVLELDGPEVQSVLALLSTEICAREMSERRERTSA